MWTRKIISLASPPSALVPLSDGRHDNRQFMHRQSLADAAARARTKGKGHRILARKCDNVSRWVHLDVCRGARTKIQGGACRELKHQLSARSDFQAIKIEVSESSARNTANRCVLSQRSRDFFDCGF